MCVPFPAPGAKREAVATRRRFFPPSVRRFIDLHYYIGASDDDPRYGSFVGLVCSGCECFVVAEGYPDKSMTYSGHQDRCAVAVLEHRARAAQERARRRHPAPIAGR